MHEEMKMEIEELHKEIDLVQGCINRMAQNSFHIKGYETINQVARDSLHLNNNKISLLWCTASAQELLQVRDLQQFLPI